MPTFIDHHEELPPMPAEAMDQMKQMIESGEPNQFGAKALNIYMGADGSAYCLSEAPDVDAILKSHEAAGVPLNNESITQVQGVV